MQGNNFKLKILLLYLTTASKKTQQREDSNYCPSSMSFRKLAELFNVSHPACHSESWQNYSTYEYRTNPFNCAAAHQYVLQ